MQTILGHDSGDFPGSKTSHKIWNSEKFRQWHRGITGNFFPQNEEFPRYFLYHRPVFGNSFWDLPIFVHSHPTRLSYPLPYELAKKRHAYWNNAYEICNPKSGILCWFLISQWCHGGYHKMLFPAHVRCVKFWNFHYRFLCILPKDAELNFKGSNRGYFRDQGMFCTSKVNFGPFWRKIALDLNK